MITIEQALDKYSKQINKKQYLPARVEMDLETGLNAIHKIGKAFCPHFIIDNINKPQLSQMFYYFTGQFEKFKGDPEKGILAVGYVGTGKTLSMVIFQHFLDFLEKTGQLSFNTFTPRFNIAKCTEIKSGFEDQETGGMNTLKKYKTRHSHICFDDMIEEVKDKSTQMAAHYSVKINVMENILTARAELFKVHRTITHATSNYPIESTSGKTYWKDYYGDRVADRAVEMFNIIQFKGDSRRK